MIANLKHTPGPWVVAMVPEVDGELMPDGSGGMSYTGRMVYDRQYGVLTKEDAEQGEYEPEPIARPWNEADAHLIAAAPDLLAEARYLVLASESRDDRPDWLVRRLESLRAVIARATGEQIPTETT